MAIGNASAFAPDAAKAEQSAKRIFKLIDLVPNIDAQSTEGKRLDKVGEVDNGQYFFNCGDLSLIVVISK